MNTSHRDMSLLTIEQRRAKVIDLRRQRMTWHAIGDALGVSHEQARQDYLAVLRDAKDRRLDAGDIALEEHLSELEDFAAQYRQRASADERAAAVYLRAMDQIARLKNLYPQGHDEAAASQTIVLQFNSWTQPAAANQPAPAALPDPNVIDAETVDADETTAT